MDGDMILVASAMGVMIIGCIIITVTFLLAYILIGSFLKIKFAYPKEFPHKIRKAPLIVSHILIAIALFIPTGDQRQLFLPSATNKVSGY